MTDNLSYEEVCLLKLISSALTDNSFVAFDKSPDWRIVFKLAKRHAVCAVLYDVLAGREDLPREYKKVLADESQKTVLQSYRLLFLSRALVDSLEAAGIPSLVLKGACVAELYPVPELRKSGDVDVLILNPERINDACRELEGAGFTVNREQRAKHHVGMCSRENIEVELHTMLAEPFDSRRINNCIKEAAAKCAQSVVAEDVMGVSLPRLADAYQAYSLLLHMLGHFLRSGFGLKLLCDWVAFWNREYSRSTEERYIELVSECGIKGFSDIVTLACVRFLGLKPERVQFMLKGDVCVSSEDVEAFIREVFDAEEFGKSEKSRMVALRGTKLSDFAREFHHQTCLNFPKASKAVVILPGLWAITLWRFLRNNRRIRRVSTYSILKNARSRSKLIKKLKLFETV